MNNIRLKSFYLLTNRRRKDIGEAKLTFFTKRENRRHAYYILFFFSCFLVTRCHNEHGVFKLLQSAA